MHPKNIHSTRDKISIAPSIEAVEDLVRASKRFEYAKPATLRRIEEAGDKRIFILKRREKQKDTQSK